MRRPLLAALLAAAVLGGCGGEDSAAKTAYEQQFKAAREEFTARAKALDEPPNDAPAQERAAAGRAAAEEVAGFVDELEALDPPDEVARAHADLTAAFRESAELTAQAAQKLRDGDEDGLREIARKLSDRSATDQRAEEAVQVFAEHGYQLDLDFDLGE